MSQASLLSLTDSLKRTAAAATDRKRPVVITRYASTTVLYIAQVTA